MAKQNGYIIVNFNTLGFHDLGILKIWICQDCLACH